MKMHLYKNLFSFPRFLICIDNKEIFINQSFENIDIALICLEKNSIERKEVWLNTIKSSLILEKELSVYISENKFILNEIKNRLTLRHLNFSWLQIMQIMILNEDDSDIDKNISNLQYFYEKNIVKELIL